MDLLPKLHARLGRAQEVAAEDSRAQTFLKRKVKEHGRKQAQHRETESDVEILVAGPARGREHGGQRTKIPKKRESCGRERKPGAPEEARTCSIS